MGSDFLAERGKGLEEAFFAREDAVLRGKLAALDEGRHRKAALAQASGIADEAALDRLVELGMSSALLAALSLAPPVLVAWADGSIEPEERKVLLASAEQAGLDKEHPGYALFAGWLDRKPPANLFETWSAYVTAFLPTLDGDARQTLRAGIFDRSHAVAEAAGGFLRLTARTSHAEKTMLKEIERVLAG